MFRLTSRILRNSEIKFSEAAKKEFKFQAEREHHASKLGDTWKKVSMFVCVPIIIGCAVSAYVRETKHLSHFEMNDVPYHYLSIRHKPFPWGEGQKSFFHHDKYNYIKEQ